MLEIKHLFCAHTWCRGTQNLPIGLGMGTDDLSITFSSNAQARLPVCGQSVGEMRAR